MKTKSAWVVVGLCGLLASSAWGAEDAKKPATPGPAASSTAPAKPSHASTDRASEAAKAPASAASGEAAALQKLPPELAESKAIEQANKEHIEPMRDRLTVETPPPPPRTEKRPSQPAVGMVWVPGHWVPTKGEWHWRAGEWGVPATPISVWIDAKYDPKTKQWSAGYWQPDRVEPYQSAPEDKEQQPREKFF